MRLRAGVLGQGNEHEKREHKVMRVHTQVKVNNSRGGIIGMIATPYIRIASGGGGDAGSSPAPGSNAVMRLFMHIVFMV